MVVEQSNIDHIMRGLQSTEGVRLHNHRKKLRQRFDIIKKLGQGTYGKVQLGINKETGQEVAIKTIKKCKIETEADLIRIRREIQIMSSVRHPNIIHIYEVFENREKMVLVMEYAAGGELYDYLNERKVLEETEARRIFRQISTAVYYCHKHKICHRDLKLENILIDEHGSAKIADFGLSNVYDEKRLLQTFCGSPLYASPEIVRGTPYRGPEVDCWSLGVLLYTLVYGAMPFDGSNFKRLVKQISNGEYFEPKKPKASPASPLIKEMLTVDPSKRATVEQICAHWWVNQGFNVSCLDIAEDLANQTPVRLDLLLSLAPPPENSEKLVVTDDQAGMSVQDPPPRSMSVGSLLELNSGQEDRRLELLEDKGAKRKLEAAPSETSMTKSPPKKKETRPEVADVQTAEAACAGVLATEAEVAGAAALPGPDTGMEVEAAATTETPLPTPSIDDAQPEAAISSDKPTRKSVKTVKKKVTKDGVEVKKKKSDTSPEKKPAEEKEKPVKKNSSRSSVPKDEPGKEIKREGSTRRSQGAKANLKLNLKKEREKSEPPTPDEGPAKPTERRKSKIFETAEKFMSPEPKSPTVEKPKKVFIPGVKVSDFAKAFERKSSIPTSTTPVLKSSPSKKIVPKDDKSSPKEQTPTDDAKSETPVCELNSSPPPKEPTPINDEKIAKLKDSARSVIANALNEEERKKVKKQVLKPPVPKQKTEDADALENKKKAMTLQIGNEKATVEVHTPEHTKFLFEPDKNEDISPEKTTEESPKEKKTAKVNITLKSNTLPRRTTKAEILLASPGSSPTAASNSNYRTEVEHRVGDTRPFHTQRSEVAFPVSAAQKPLRSVSLEPENKRKERIIPIQFEGKGDIKDEARDRVAELERQDSQTVRGRPPLLPYQRTLSQRSSSLSRQSTQDSDTESTMSTSGDPIRKSPREVIIPIAVEGGGYITPRATSLEPSESMSKRRPFPRRISLFSDNGSEDESSWKHDKDEPFGLLRLRSSRAARSDRADSQSGSDDDEDDGFEILTAENLFSTLLSRVQNLTQKLNVDHGGRPGFPSTRLSSQRLFGGFHEPLTRLSERSLSREMESGRWPRGVDVSHTIRSVPRDRSRGRQHEPDVASVSGSRSNSRTRDGRQQTHSEPGQQPYMRTWSVRDDRHTPAHRSISDNSHTYPRLKARGDGSKIPSYSRSLSGKDDHSYNRASSLRKESTPVYSRNSSREDTSFSRASSRDDITQVYKSALKDDGDQLTPTRERPPSHIRSQSESEPAQPPDFYEILAEKYGVVPARRYDTERRKRSMSREPKSESLNDGADSSISDKSNAQSVPPPRIKKESTPSDRFQSPSEKLAAVLSQLQGSYDKKETMGEARGIPNELLYPKKDKPKNRQTEFIKIENDRLKELSPKALELYEKTLGLYQKTLTDKNKPKEDSKKSRTEGTPEQAREDYFRSKKLKNYVGQKNDKENTSCELLKVTNSEGEAAREDSPSTISKKEKLIRRLSRELESEMSAKDDLVMRRRPSDATKPDSNLIKRLSRELEKEMQKDKTTELRNSPVESVQNQDPPKTAARTKILSTLDKKLDLLRPATEKKYLGKAIKSLQENSAGAGEIVSENVLIKRAVSLSECSEPKSTTGPIQSTVNSMVNFFKKSETGDASQAGINLVESTPPLTSPEGSPNKDSKNSPRHLSNSPSIISALAPENLRGSFNDSSSFVSPDSESYDSWSNCSDFGTPDEIAPVVKSTSPIMRNYGDESPTESVGERIRRKSFYSRFNDRRKSRKGTEKKSDNQEIPAYKKSVTQNLEKARSPQPYGRSTSSTDYTRKWYDDSRPRPFYKSEVTGNNDAAFRKTSLDWSHALTPPTFVRSISQTSSVTAPSGSSTLPRSLVGSYNSRKPPIDPDRPFSPTRLRTPGRLFSPRTSLTPSPTCE